MFISASTSWLEAGFRVQGRHWESEEAGIGGFSVVLLAGSLDCGHCLDGPSSGQL